jgi:hypothetical protein
VIRYAAQRRILLLPGCGEPTEFSDARVDVFDFAAMERYTRRLAAAVDSVIHIRNVIRNFKERGDTSVLTSVRSSRASSGSATTGVTESIPACCSARPGSTWQTAGSAST